jgi:hypothetical protein
VGCYLLIQCLLILLTYLHFLVDTSIFYGFNCFYCFLQKEFNNTQIALEIHEILRGPYICPHIILKNVWTIKYTRCQRFFHLTFLLRELHVKSL